MPDFIRDLESIREEHAKLKEAIESDDNKVWLRRTLIKMGVPLTMEVPFAVKAILLLTNPDSNSGFARVRRGMCKEINDDLNRLFQINSGITDEDLHGLYKDVCKGVMFTEKWLKQNKGQTICDKLIGFSYAGGIPADHPLLEGTYAGAVTETSRITGEKKVRIEAFPALVIHYGYQETCKRHDKNYKPERIYPDPHLPNMLFNAREMAILSGIEEAAHAYQFLRPDQDKGPSKPTYDANDVTEAEYYNDLMEKEITPILEAAVEVLRLGTRMDTVSAAKKPRRHR